MYGYFLKKQENEKFLNLSIQTNFIHLKNKKHNQAILFTYHLIVLLLIYNLTAYILWSKSRKNNLLKIHHRKTIDFYNKFFI